MTQNIAKNDYMNMHGRKHHVLDGASILVAFKNGIEYIKEHYNVTLEKDDVMCEYSGMNEQCIKERCPYYQNV